MNNKIYFLIISLVLFYLVNIIENFELNEQLTLLNKINNYYNNIENLHISLNKLSIDDNILSSNKNNKLSLDSDNGYLNIYSTLTSKYNKKINYSLLDILDRNEIIIVFKYLSEKDIAYINKDDTNNNNYSNINNYNNKPKLDIINNSSLGLILLITNNRVLLLNINLKLIAMLKLTFNIKNANIDNFEDNNNIVFLIDNEDLLLIKIKIENLSLENYFNFIDNNTNYIPIDLKILKQSKFEKKCNNILDIKQFSLHSKHYYFTLCTDNDAYKSKIVVYDSKLNTKTTMNYKGNNLLDKGFIYKGILGLVSKNKVFFTNVLGGNSILLECYNYSSIVHTVYESNYNMLYILNTHGDFYVYNIKLSMSKINTNECNGNFNISLLIKYLNSNLQIQFEQI